MLDERQGWYVVREECKEVGQGIVGQRGGIL
jgi:hypothetical protein